MKAPFSRIGLLFLACILLVHIAWCQSPSTYVDSSNGEAQINVFAGERASFTIPRTVYGTFLEDIGYSVFAGVSAELLDNPSLEAYDASLGASWMNMLLGHADFVPVSDMTGLVEFAGIYKKRGRVFVTPQYWAFSLYSNYAGGTPVRTRTEGEEYNVQRGAHRVPDILNVPFLDVLATTDSVHHNLALFVVNRDWRRAIPAAIDLKDFIPGPEATVRTLNADSILTKNDEEHPDTIRPVTTRLKVASANFRYEFPAHSVTVISLVRQ
jgi:alpha-N-arabinofuranosidase